MVKVKLPRYMVARKFKGHLAYYWIPRKADQVRHGLLPRRLADRTNLLADAIAAAEAFNADLDARRAGAVEDPAPKIRGTLPWLWRDFQASTKYTQIAAKTQDFYDHNWKIIEKWSAKAKHINVARLTRAACLDFYQYLCRPDAVTEEVMLPRAKAVMTTLRRMLKHSVDLGLMEQNPATEMELISPPPREAIWTDEDVKAFIDAAVTAGRPSLALAVHLAGDLGPRRGDVLRLSLSAYKDGRFTLRPRKPSRLHQGKLGRWIKITAMPPLAARMDGLAKSDATTIVVNENTGRPYAEDTFSHDFRVIADGCGLKHLLFMDLRRTAVVNLARAGCTVPEIASITGHSERTVYELLAVYLPLDAEVADNAIAKLAAYRAAGADKKE